MRRLIPFLFLASAAAAPLAAQVADPQDQRPRGDWRRERAEPGVAARPAQGEQAPSQNARIGRSAGQYGGSEGADPRRGNWSGTGGRFAQQPDAGPSGDLGQRPATTNERFSSRGNGPSGGVDPRSDRDRNGGFAGQPGVERNNGFDRRGGYDRNNRSDSRWGGGGNGYAGRPGIGRSDGYAGRPGEWRDDRHFDGGGGWSSQWRNDRRYDWQGYRAANRNLYRAPRYYGPRGYDYAPWRRGYRVQPFFYGQNYWISDPWRYRLPPAGGYYRWVRYYDDVALIDIRTGLIEDIIYSFFWR